ncbi:AAA family ATPase [Rahnella bruchi]|nr:AAA family ATPase [Rahnella bruchi]
MIQIDLPMLVSRLNILSKQSLELAAAECVNQQGTEITVAHVLSQMLMTPRSDVRVIIEQAGIDADELLAAITLTGGQRGNTVGESYPSFSPLLVEWLKDAWLLASADMQVTQLRGGILLLALLHSPLRYVTPAATQLLAQINRDLLRLNFFVWTRESAESALPEDAGKSNPLHNGEESMLARYSANVTEDARNGKLDPVLCRDNEIDLMIDILCRRRKNNPIVVGEAGVGKSALTACARVAINLTSPPRQISALTTQRHQYEAEIRQLEREQRIGLLHSDTRLLELHQLYEETGQQLNELDSGWQHQRDLVHQIIALRHNFLAIADEEPDSDESVAEKRQTLQELMAKLDALHQTRKLVSPHVDKGQISAVIAEWTGVPLNRLSQSEMTLITELPVWLGEKIQGQSLAIEQLHKHLLTARADLRRPGRPLGAFLLAGPSGVGKTETVLQLAELLFGGRQYLTTINMSEFQEKHTVSRLIGSPPGYVGYGEGGVLTEAIRQKPYSVVLLDEVEKAHPDVLNLFYQAFDKGEMSDGEGRLIDCKNVVFFLTSNLGYQVIVEHASRPEQLLEALYPVLADFFKPALLARMETIPFLPLSAETLITIIAAKLARLETLLHKRFGAEVIVDAQVSDEIMLRVTRAENGARMLESIIDGEVLPPLSLLLLQKLAAGSAIKRVQIAVTDHRFTADIQDTFTEEEGGLCAV